MQHEKMSFFIAFLCTFNVLTCTRSARILVYPNDLYNNAEFKSLVKIGGTLAERHEVTLLTNNKCTPDSREAKNSTVVTYALPDDLIVAEIGKYILQGNNFFKMTNREQLEARMNICQALLKRQYLTIQLQLQNFDLIIADNDNICARVLIDYLKIPAVVWCYNSHDISCDFFDNSVVAVTSKQDFFLRLKFAMNYFLYLNLYQPSFIFRPFDELKHRYGYGKGLSVSGTFFRAKPLVILNADFSVDMPRAVMPFVVPIAGLLFKEVEKLPKDIDEFLAKSGKNGVIYMDTPATDDWLIQRHFASILETLIQNDYRVILKSGFNSSKKLSIKLRSIPSSLANTVLADKRIKLIITRCHQSSVHQMAFYGVPSIFLSTFKSNADYCNSLLEEHETGIVLNIMETGIQKTLKQINNLMTNSMYKDNAARLSKIFKHQIKGSKDRLFHWVDFVSIYKRVDSLHRNNTTRLPWYQQYMLDVTFFVLFVSFALLVLITLIAYFLIKKLLNSFFGTQRKKSKLN